MRTRIYRVAFEGEQFYAVEQDGGLRRVDGDLYSNPRVEGPAINRGAAQLLSPVQPSKIVGIGFNYRNHAAEMHTPLPKEPLLFLKPPTAVIGPGDVIRWPALSDRVEYEGELALVIGRTAKDVPRDRALDYVFGLTCMNDVTARDIQGRDSQLTRPKGFDTFAPIGPCIACGLDPNNLAIQTRVNGEAKQTSSTACLIFDVSTLIAYISQVMTLLPGDVISTGTPGTGPLQRGDQVSVEIDGIGELTNTIM